MQPSKYKIENAARLIPVRFDCHGRNAPAYGCSLPGDMSGVYYKAADVDALIAEVRRQDIEIALLQRVAHECSVECCDTRQTVTAQMIADDISARLEEGK